ncbi:ABC transporter substrate-binding protein [Aquibacillus koreensis]|uniref:ABC transporter substrate-binding protein n=1 Tax=Aquibacillus koreensis TaxID=279446 RepID=A0A9X3WPU4_9BACI|nr:ABC transporter substrate-binding protein [Aquibacillus koreensis]MCT2536151.1 ABC transporter substrate-binding protein [Aquibacillus koreensis]MDC3422076.1 ABC transporter substrate-binding protein [Aquibacillus koreensis]
MNVRNNKWLFILVIAMISMFVLAACGTDEDTTSSSEPSNETEEDTNQEAEEAGEAEGETYVIGATQIVEHPSLNAAYEGFQEAIADAGLEVEYDFQSAQNDVNNGKTIANNFVADSVDLIFANSTPSAQSALAATKDIPIIFTSVTDAVAGGLVEAMDQPGENITGVLDLHPDAIKNTIEFIDTYFEGSKVGLIYNSGEANSVAQIDAVNAAIEGTSLSTVERTVATSAEVQQATTTLVGEADVIYVITDNTVVDALEAVIGVSNEQDIPLIVGEPNSVEKGGFATYGIDYHTIGYRAGEMAVEVLTGQKATSDIPVEIPPEMQLFINKAAAEEQGIDWNAAWDEEAQFLETKSE